MFSLTQSQLLCWDKAYFLLPEEGARTEAWRHNCEDLWEGQGAYPLGSGEQDMTRGEMGQSGCVANPKGNHELQKLKGRGARTHRL